VCLDGKDGAAGQCNLCQQKGQEPDTRPIFQFPDEEFDGSGSGAIACCWENDTVDGTGKCVGLNPPCDQISAATYDGGDNILYLRNITDLSFMDDMYMLDCGGDGCCYEVPDTVDLAMADDPNTDCDYYLQTVDATTDCGAKGFRVKVVGGLEADLGSASGLDFDLYQE